MEISINEINELKALELLEKVYGKKLDCKKNILEYIDIMKILRQEGILEEKVQENYNLIYSSIENISDTVKLNTIMHLKNQLKAQLGKLVKDKDPKEEHSFIKYFKMAYPPRERSKGFTRVLEDINKITDEQIWTTIAYINRGIIKNELYFSNDEKDAIIEKIKKLISKNNIKYVNQIKSMEKLLRVLKIKVVNKKDKFEIKEVF